MKTFLFLFSVFIVVGAVQMFNLHSLGCKHGLGLVNCFVDPCMFQRQNGCANHPDAKCVSNYCGGCNHDWKLPNGTIVHCGGPIISIP